MASWQFESFLNALDAPVTFSRDSIDGFGALGFITILTGDERVAAEDLLIERVRTTDDGRLPYVLAEAGCVRAVPVLRERAATSASAAMRSAAAWAAQALAPGRRRD